MRDYNKIPFRSPSSGRNNINTKSAPQQQQQQQQQGAMEPDAVEEKKVVVNNSNSHSSHSKNGPNHSTKNSETTTSTVTTLTSHPSRARSPSPINTQQPSPPQTHNHHHHHRHQQPHPNSPNTNNTASSPSSQSSSQLLSAADALAVRRNGAEMTIQRLRMTLEETTRQDATSRAALAKSDAMILELRSSIRQMKRQVEKLQDEKRSVLDEKQAMEFEMRKARQSAAAANNSNSSNNSPTSTNRHLSFEEQSADARDARVGELQVQLDRAHAQILTADMVRKELEDTLEAEQYTWELRVQDQERTIEQLQQECGQLADDLDQCRKQWKEAEDTWSHDLQELQSKLAAVQQEAQHWKSMQKDTKEVGELKERLLIMEQERSELQSCLDEALKELEAVDAELQGDSTSALREENKRLREMVGKQDSRVLEPLQHLYRWLLERDGIEATKHSSLNDSRELLAAIKSHLELTPSSDKDIGAAKKHVADLQSQLSVYRGDLKAREESTLELRASLKEAVSLLKPLQDAVAKADLEKARMQETINRLKESGADSEKNVEIRVLRQSLREKDEEIDTLREAIESLELQLSRAKLETANGVMQNQRSVIAPKTPDSLTKAREEIRAKRAAEMNLKQLLRDAQSRFNNTHRQGDVDQSDSRSIASSDIVNTLQHTIETRDAKLHELESETQVLRGELARKDVEIRTLGKKMLEAENSAGRHHEGDSSESMPNLKKQLATTMQQLKEKKEVEKALNKSLKEALGLLKPLQSHLEEAEQEKRNMAKEMRFLRQKLGEPASSSKGSPDDNKDKDSPHGTVRDLEVFVRQLEMENSQLYETIEDMSQSINVSHLSGVSNNNNGDAKAKEALVEMKSRYEVTKGRLEDAYLENQTLLEGLKKRDKEEKAMVDELHVLREKLKKSEAELENAKFIATSALVKVEELTMANVEQLSLNSSVEQEALYQEKVKEYEQASAQQRRNRAPYRLA